MSNDKVSGTPTLVAAPLARGSLFLQHWPLLAAIALLFAIGWPCISEALRRNDGHWVYPLDDTYIHLAVAKTFAATGIWGLTEQSGFASGVSSLLYPVLLAAIYRLVGFRELAPFTVSLVGALLLLWWTAAKLREETSSGFCRFVVLAGIVWLTPLVPLVFGGMEHTLHAFFSVFFLFDAGQALAQSKAEPDEDSCLNRRLMIMAVLLGAIRYEALFLVCAVCGFLLLRGKWRLAFTLGGLALLPAAIYGLISVSQGWYFLPNSLLLKSHTPGATFSAVIDFFNRGIQQLIFNLHLYGVAVAAATGFFFQAGRGRTFWERKTTMCAIFLITLLLHMLFGRTGWLYRYEAYLIVMALVLMGITLLAPLFRKWQEARLLPSEAVAYGLLAFLLLWPAILRGNDALRITPLASNNVYEQQYQMGLFLQKHYPRARVAANDVGAITRFTQIYCLDLFGLFDKEVLRAKRAGEINTAYFRRLAEERGVDIAMVYDHWYESAGGIPTSWTKVGEWKIHNNEVLGGDVVAIYAVKPELAGDLKAKLREFSPRLPKTVEQRGAYLDPTP